MSSTLSQSGTRHSHLDRKAMKRPDEFFVALKNFFDGMGSHIQGLMIVVVAIVVVSAVGVYWMSHRDAREEAANNALFIAQKSLEADYKAAAQAIQIKSPELAHASDSKAPKKPDAQADVAKAAQKQENDKIVTALFRKLDVNSSMPATVQKFKVMIETYSGTRAGFEATLELAGIYLNHGEPSKATPLFQKALASAPTAFDKTAAASGLGHSYEDAGAFADAAKAYEAVVQTADPALKGEVLLPLARSYEALKDKAKAKSTYDQIIAQMPATEYSKAAESQKALLE